MSSTFKKGANAAKYTISEHVRIVNFKNSRLACLKKIYINVHLAYTSPVNYREQDLL